METRTNNDLNYNIDEEFLAANPILRDSGSEVVSPDQVKVDTRDSQVEGLKKYISDRLSEEWSMCKKCRIIEIPQGISKCGVQSHSNKDRLHGLEVRSALAPFLENGWYITISCFNEKKKKIEIRELDYSAISKPEILDPMIKESLDNRMLSVHFHRERPIKIQQESNTVIKRPFIAAPVSIAGFCIIIAGAFSTSLPGLVFGGATIALAAILNETLPKEMRPKFLNPTKDKDIKKSTVLTSFSLDIDAYGDIIRSSATDKLASFIKSLKY